MEKAIKRKVGSGQTFLEYMLLFSIVTGVVVAMSPMVRRFAQSMIKLTADQIGEQSRSDQKKAGGYLINSEMGVEQSSYQAREDRLGVTTYYPSSLTSESTTQFTDLGTAVSTEIPLSQRGGEVIDPDPNPSVAPLPD